jgi:hypothetical protein
MTQVLKTFFIALSGMKFPAAAKLLRTSLDLPENWWVAFEMKQSVCDDISNQIMDLYDEGS